MEFISVLSSIISNKFVASSVVIVEVPKSSKISNSNLEYFFNKFVYVPVALEIFISSSKVGTLV